MEDGTPIITVEHLGEQGVMHKNLPLVSEKDRNRLNAYILRTGDIAFSRVGSVDRNALISNRESGWLFSGRLLRIRVTEIAISSIYLSYYFHKETTKQRIRSVAVGQTMASLNTHILNNFIVILPPTREEQTAIATALSDTDALISRLEALIAKKRAIKQGAMQQLLKPKEGWEVKALGEICSPSKSRINPLISTENYKCIELEHLSQESGRLLGFANSIDLKSQKTAFQKGDVLFGKLRPYLKKYFFAEFDGVCTTEIWVLKAAKGVHSRWLYYLVQSDRIIEAANMSTGTKMPRAEWKIVSSTLIYLPTPKEQTRMAKILSDMDTEIAGLEQKLAKYKLVKQGMMQELLTGKTRLV